MQMQKWAEMDLTSLVKRTPKNEKSLNADGNAPGSGGPNAGQQTPIIRRRSPSARHRAKHEGRGTERILTDCRNNLAKLHTKRKLWLLLHVLRSETSA
jgi:hypothetical protein